MLKDLSLKPANVFCCEVCDYNCSKQSDYNKHLLTLKHKSLTKLNSSLTKNTLCEFKCINCEKIYKSRVGLWYHKNKCKNETIQIPCNTNDDLKTLSNLVFEVVKSNNELQKQTIDIQKQNQDLQQQILDVCKNGIIQNNTINANNSNNKTFNLQVFLNEECKDAMNISDFMSSIQVQLEELESVGRLGFVVGISNIIIKNLKALDIRKRPVHCTDLKRETVYIKENGVWVKDDESNTKLRKLIKNVSFRNSKNTRLYRDKYPDCVRSESRLSGIYSIIIIEAMGGGSKTDPKEEEDKIVRRILKDLVFDKSMFLS